MMMVLGISKAMENTILATVYPINYIRNKLRRSHEIRAIEDNSDHSSKSNSPVQKSVSRQPTITASYALNNSMSPPRIVEQSATSEDTPIEENRPEFHSTQTSASMLGGHRIQYYDNNLLTSDAMIDVSLRLINTNQSEYESDAWTEKEKKVRFI